MGATLGVLFCANSDAIEESRLKLCIDRNQYVLAHELCGRKLRTSFPRYGICSYILCLIKASETERGRGQRW